MKSKGRKHLSDNIKTFNDIRLTTEHDGTIKKDQSDKIEMLRTPSTEPVFISIRAKARYIGVNCRPDMSAAIELIAPGSEPIKMAEMRSTRQVGEHLKISSDTGLKYKYLDFVKIRLIVSTDAPFANARDMEIQSSNGIGMVDDNGNAKIIHFGTNRYRRAVRSVMAEEIHALVLGFDFAFAIAHMLEEVLRTATGMEAYVNCKTVFDVSSNDSNTGQRKLQIDISSIRKRNAREEMGTRVWLPGKTNPADTLKMSLIKKNTPLWAVMTNNKVKLRPVGWVMNMN